LPILPAFCSLLLPAYFSNFFAGKIGAPLETANFGLKFLMDPLWYLIKLISQNVTDLGKSTTSSHFTPQNIYGQNNALYSRGIVSVYTELPENLQNCLIKTHVLLW